MSLDRGRSESDRERETGVRTVDGASAEQQVLSLHTAIGNAAFSRLVARSLAPELSRKNVGKRSGHKKGGIPIPPDVPDLPSPPSRRRGTKGSGKRSSEPRSAPGSGMLRFGSTGSRVTTLQMDLSVYASRPVAVDGIFGPETDGAVRSFQEEEGLVADGIVGPLTLGALGRRKSGLTLTG